MKRHERRSGAQPVSLNSGGELRYRGERLSWYPEVLDEPFGFRE
ncbi:hypothetical protein ACNKHS_25995 [Shigella flexneri]